MFYYDRYWRIWVRRLMETDGVYGKRFVDISMTGVNGEWEEVKEERIRIHCTLERVELVENLPQDVADSMTNHLGEELTISLIWGNYVGFFGLQKLLRADNAWTYGGGFPLEFACTM